MMYPGHLANCTVTLQSPSASKSNGVEVLTHGNTYTGIPARIWPDSSNESRVMERETGFRRSVALLPVAKADGTSILVGKSWRVMVSAVYPQNGPSQLAVNQKFRVTGPALNAAGHDVAQSVYLEEVS